MLATLLKVFPTFMPRLLREPMQNMTIKARRTAYSTEASPSSPLRKWRRPCSRFRTIGFLPFRVAEARNRDGRFAFAGGGARGKLRCFDGTLGRGGRGVKFPAPVAPHRLCEAFRE